MTTQIDNTIAHGPGSDDWKAAVSGDFNTKSDWSKDRIPGAGTSVFIQRAGTYAITSNRDNTIANIDFTAGPSTLAIAAGTTFTIEGIKSRSSLAGTIAVDDGATLVISGKLDDNGNIAVGSSIGATMEVAGDFTLTEAEGKVTLTGNNAQLVSNGAAAKLVNRAAIEGEGTIGDSNLTLVNDGGIYANDANALTIDTAGTVLNIETIEASGAGGLSIMNNLANNGSLIASDSSIVLGGSLTGRGKTSITNGGSVEVAKGVADTQTIFFGASNGGTLILDQAQSFAGTVSNLDTQDAIDLANFAWAGKPEIASVTSTEVNSTAMVAITITDRALTATILLNNMGGNYSTSAGDYSLSSDNDTANGHHPGTVLHMLAFAT